MSTDPYYQDDYITLYLGDNQEVIPSIDMSHIDLLLSDPPYGVKWDTSYTRVTHGSSPALSIDKDRQPIEGDGIPFDPAPYLTFPKVILWGANCYSQRLPQGTWLIWDKRFTSGNSFFSSDGEAAWMKGGHGIRIYSQTWQGVCRAKRYADEQSCLNPAQKPVALGMWCIEQARNVKAMLDPFAGSGSFLIAAKEMGIHAIGCEITERHAELAATRLQDVCAGFLFG